MGCMELSSYSCADIGVPTNWRRVSQGILIVDERKWSHLSCMMGTRELFWSQCRGIGLNLELFGLPRNISHSCGDISVLLVLWGISGGLSVLLSSKSRLLTCLIGNKELICTQCRGIRPHLSASGKSDCVSRVAVGSWGMLSSYGGGSH